MTDMDSNISLKEEDLPEWKKSLLEAVRRKELFKQLEKENAVDGRNVQI